MSKVSNTRWILFFSVIAFWILMIQIAPRFLPFDFERIKIFGLNIHTDYLTHVLLFVTLVIIISVLHLRVKTRFLLPIMLIAAFVAEVVQIYIPKRTYNIWDLLSNVLGVFIGIIIVAIIRQHKYKKDS